MSLAFAAAWAAVLFASAASASAVPSGAHGAWGVAYPPADTSAPRPALVFLHGMGWSPEDSCPAFRAAAVRFGFLVCPRGNAPLTDGRKTYDGLNMWTGTAADAAGPIRAALDEAARTAPGKLDRAGEGTLLGFSNGAYFAAETAIAEPGRWPGLVLLSMKLDLDRARLLGAGVRRVVLGAGDLDEAGASMRELAARLDGGGLRVRFTSLGRVGHAFPPDMASRMCDAIAWVREAGPAACAGL